jgi:hypothetical protein
VPKEYKLDSRFITVRKPIAQPPPMPPMPRIEKKTALSVENRVYHQSETIRQQPAVKQQPQQQQQHVSTFGDTSGCGIGLSSRLGDYLCKCDICKEWIYSRVDKVRLGPYLSHRDCVKCFICDESLHEFKIYVQVNSQNNGIISC